MLDGARDLDPVAAAGARVAEVSGETRRRPVAAGAGDQAAGALGVGVVRPGPLSVALGTSGVVFAALAGYGPTPRGASTPSATRCRRLDAMGVMLRRPGRSAGRDSSAPAALRRARRRGRGAGARAPRGSSSCPYLAGERTPHPTPTRAAPSSASTLRHDEAPRAAVLEGVAYGLRDSLDPSARWARRTSARVPPAAARGAPAAAADLRRRPRPPHRADGPWRRGPPTARRCSPVWRLALAKRLEAGGRRSRAGHARRAEP